VKPDAGDIEIIANKNGMVKTETFSSPLVS